MSAVALKPLPCVECSLAHHALCRGLGCECECTTVRCDREVTVKRQLIARGRRIEKFVKVPCGKPGRKFTVAGAVELVRCPDHRDELCRRYSDVVAAVEVSR